jgi:hypothetical protein
MCRLSSAPYEDLYRRANLDAGRLLLAWLRGRFDRLRGAGRAHRPKVRQAPAAPLPARTASARPEPGREDAKAA